ncbi:EamA family transporter [Pseudoalteromonas luteoviolacea]|uniref:Threonine transporter RhtB n=1 Tax=Pseudoalteromonas luteoviolacea S4054 TaxID=1129367 RepID=A0A0F6AFN3_9GAMM|nr:DMT family transporter [Pseudoalteromonas luteoviolacea]AOT10353.1 transporter [Pseudoalteromonas luteoviolacea]AOT15578.1 transporter [Pseudoalteromonas luteoviolacea]AOT20171.1 transporter [Pseudoalteromonas luteoviolacea]KKE84616.1 threonine transporter RhtB [Pseudoalteromonas luteoviolacea S4054]KZN71239.1 threonine transporter RhtB [Pseudoalteromonas luteoviolacea S4047-1]
MQLLDKRFLYAIACLLLAMITIQSGASIAKQLFPHVGPEGTTAYRLGFSALILCLVFKPWRKLPTNWRPVILYGLSLGVMNLTFYYAIARIPLGIGVALEFIGPLAVALFASKRKRDYLWVLLATVGIFLLLPDINSVDGLDPIGVILALTAGACWAGYIIFGKKTGSQGSGGMAVALGMSVAAIAVVPYGIISQGSALLNWSLIPLGIAIALLSSALPYTLEMIALKNIPAQGFSIMVSLEPAIAALAGLLILGELLTIWQWTAILLVIAASVGSSISTKKS